MNSLFYITIFSFYFIFKLFNDYTISIPYFFDYYNVYYILLSIFYNINYLSYGSTFILSKYFFYFYKNIKFYTSSAVFSIY